MKILILGMLLYVTSCATVVGQDNLQEVQVDEEPTPMVIIQPRYPREAAINGVSGMVKFRFDILPDGSPTNLQIIDSSPEGVFDYQAERAIKKWKFKPAIKNGKAVMKSNLVYTVKFEFDESLLND